MVTLVDTPGLNSPYESHTQATQAFIERADAVSVSAEVAKPSPRSRSPECLPRHLGGGQDLPTHPSLGVVTASANSRMSQSREGKTMPDPVAYHLAGAINRWIQRTPGQYSIDSTLSGMWNARWPNVNYVPEGIRTLHGHLAEDPAFGQCSSFQTITPGELAPGGDIQKVRDLYVRLQGCVQPALSEEFAQSQDVEE
jgi:hypothetical protein